VKVLDFGLAKALESPAGVGTSATMSPTITTPAMTQAGVILGTAAYMSPEQAKGRPADRRSDIWAFGCVLYEMLTGKRAFEGDDVSDTLAAVLRGEPDWSALPASTPTHMKTLLRRCVQKDPRKRLPHIGIARLDIEERAASAGADTTAPPPRRALWLRAAPYVAVIAAVSVVTALVVGRAAISTAVLPVQRLMITFPPTAAFQPGNLSSVAANPVNQTSFAISADGSRIVYVGQSAPNGPRSLYVRFLDQLDPRPLPGTENASDPFFSPDGEWVGFLVGNGPDPRTLKKVALRGGAPVAIAASLTGAPAGASWGRNDLIVFSMGLRLGGPTSPQSLYTVPAGGGSPQRIAGGGTATAEHPPVAWPDLLPDGRHMLVSVRTGPVYSQAHIVAMSLDGRIVRTVVDNGYHGRYVSSGHILYMFGGNLMAVRFDPMRLEIAGPPALLVENLGPATSRGDAAFDVSQTGVLVYAASITAPAAPRRTLVWVDRKGHEETIPAPVRAYTYPRMSPDGRLLALDVRDQDSDIWTWDLSRRILARVTTDPGADYYPTWSPDGRRLAFASTRSGRGFNLYWQNADGTGAAEQLTNSTGVQAPYCFTADGKRLIFRDSDEKTGDDLLALTLGSAGASQNTPQVEPVVRTTFNETNAELSPDGRWVAYQSNESGRDEVHVRPFPNTSGGRWTISADGGTRPVWARNGRELFYLVGFSPNPVRLMRVEVTTASGFSADAPQLVFEGQYFADPRINVRGRTYDVSPDGQRFLMIKDTDRAEMVPAPPSMTVVLNWQEELKQRVR
jgi:serine/threonine-protein kinase